MIRINEININNIIRLWDKYIRVSAYQKQICKFRIRLLQVAEKGSETLEKSFEITLL